MSAGMGSFGSRGNIWGSLKALFNLNAGWYTNAGVPTSGTSGTFAGSAGNGARLYDSTNGNWYMNVGTQPSPTWALIWNNSNATLSGKGGLGLPLVAKMSYDFAVDGGVQGLITPTNSPTIPTKAIILGGTIDITTTLTSGGSATIALGTSAGSSASSLKAATAVASWTAGQLAVIPIFTAATYLKLTAAGALTLTVATADLTAGAFDVQVLYIIGN